jgi:hypothetical protein
MEVSVHSDVVLKNIEIFRVFLEREQPSQSTAQQINFVVLLNRKTGDLKFQKKGEPALKERGWKNVILRLRGEGKKTEVEFVESENEDVQFRFDDLDPLACKVMDEMMKILNRVSSNHSLNECLTEIRALELKKLELKKKDLVHEAWHQVNRIGAEKLLAGKPVGTFLFRKDEYAALLEDQLSEKHGVKIQCFTISYLEDQNKVSDRTIVLKNGQWSYYDDDPSLQTPSFDNIDDLLDVAHKELKFPLLNPPSR